MLRQRAEAAYRRATAAEAQADLERDRAHAADIAAQRATDEHDLHIAALNMAKALLAAESTAADAEAALASKQAAARAAKDSALEAARLLQRMQSQPDEDMADVAEPNAAHSAAKQQVCPR